LNQPSPRATGSVRLSGKKAALWGTRRGRLARATVQGQPFETSLKTQIGHALSKGELTSGKKAKKPHKGEQIVGV